MSLNPQTIGWVTSDSYSSDNNSDCNDPKNNIKNNFPLDNIVDKYSDVEIDEHRDCYCKHGEVCGCGYDELYDGW